MPRPRTPFDEGVAVACEAFLSGTYVEHLLALGVAVPTWAWLNALGHGTPDTLARVATDLHTVAGRTDAWRAARAFLAGDVLELTAADGRTLAALQSAVLWPWELDVAARTDAEEWLPSMLVSSTTAAVRGRVPVRP